MRLAGRPVECTERDRSGRIVVVSCLAGEDLNAWMVEPGVGGCVQRRELWGTCFASRPSPCTVRAFGSRPGGG